MEHVRRALEHARQNFEHGLNDDTGITPAAVDALQWRHWFVSFSVRYACRFGDGDAALVECGVGDGLTAYFASIEAEQEGADYTLHCYDAWAPVTVDGGIRNYSASMARTRRNLSRFGARVQFYPGYLGTAGRWRGYLGP